jgi:imidazolonepropionase-like amidohydrolase
MNAPIYHLSGTVVIDDDHEVNDAWVVGGRVTFSRPASGAAHTLTGFFFPGLVDVHCHVGLAAQGPVDRATARAQALADRDSGVLLIRDAGSPSDTSWVGEAEDLPRLVRCGHHLARPKRYLRNYGEELADPKTLTDRLVANLDDSDGWNKIVADWIDRDVGDLTPLWTPEQLRDGLAAVHARGGRVTAHTFAREAVGPLLDAGIDCIEHGTGMTGDDMARASAAHVPVTPTLLQIAQFESIAAAGQEKFPRFASRMRELYERRYEQVRAFHEVGMQILVGTDAGGTIEHGRIADECAELVRAGIPAAEVVAFASWRARDYLGVDGLSEGASADIVGYAHDPRRDISVLQTPDTIVLRGRRVG